MKFIVVTYSDNFLDKCYKENPNERIELFFHSKGLEEMLSKDKENEFIKDFKIFDL